MKKKIVYTVLLGALAVLCIVSLVWIIKVITPQIDHYKYLKENNINDLIFYKRAITFNILCCITFLSAFSLIVFLLLKIWLLQKMLKQIKYSREDYEREKQVKKQLKKEKELKKIKRKEEKLKQKLEEIEKTE